MRRHCGGHAADCRAFFVALPPPPPPLLHSVAAATGTESRSRRANATRARDTSFAPRAALACTRVVRRDRETHWRAWARTRTLSAALRSAGSVAAAASASALFPGAQAEARAATVLYNTASREKEHFAPAQWPESDEVRFYSCGPTVYDFAHVGNFRAFLAYDTLKRWLAFCGYRVRHVMNITDVDDKIIRRVREQGVPARELTERYAREFFRDLAVLNVVPAEHYPRATHHMDDIVALISRLKERGVAYERDGSTYFAVQRFARYGRLARLDVDGARGGNNGGDGDGDGDGEQSRPRSDSDEYNKDDVRDFALWKARKDEDGDVQWDTCHGCGRPGWHIECSAMAMRYLGDTLDIHAGGVDLVFPHHENEIAQSEAASGARFARFWVHNGFVNIDGEKMSKSLGNFLTLRDAVQTAMDARAFRYMVVSSQYRSTLNFAPDTLESARNALRRLDAFRARLEAAKAKAEANGAFVVEEATANGIGVRRECERLLHDFVRHMADDLNTPRAAATVFETVKRFEKRVKGGELSASDAATVLSLMCEYDRVFGVFYTPSSELLPSSSSSTAAAASVHGADGAESEVATDNVPADVQQLVMERQAARARKEFARADALRAALAERGYVVRDTPRGARLCTRR